MLNHRSIVLALGLFLVLSTGCGLNVVPGRGIVSVDGLAAGQELLCGAQAQTVIIAGSGFLSEHGDEVIVRFTAQQGTPFQGGTSAMEEVTATVLSDTQVEVPIPAVSLGQIGVTITVILPGGNFGVSPPENLEFGGQLIGPFANFDQYGATGNVLLTVDVSTGVVDNDTPVFCGQADDDDVETDIIPSKPAPGAPDGRQGALTVIDFDATSALGGIVQVNADGSFTYDPPLGVGGTAQSPVFDSFTYTIEQDGSQDVGFVEIQIREVVWFIDDGVSPGGAGRFSDPFDSLTSFNAVQGGGNDNQPEPGDWIFVYRGNSGVTPYDDGIVLLSDQKLIGQGVDLVVNSQTIVLATERPVLTNTALSIGEEELGGPVITLGDANLVRGLRTDGGYQGVVGFGVSGPTMIDQCDFRNCNADGILLESAIGQFDIGDPLGTASPCVVISDVGGTGIQIGSGVQTSDLTSLTGLGPTVNVVATDIVDCLGNGIDCTDADLNVDFTTILDTFIGINFVTSNFVGPCNLVCTNSNVGLFGDEIRFRGIQLMPFGGAIDAQVSTTSSTCNETCLYATSFSDTVTLAFDSNDFQTLVTGLIYTVDLQGIEGGVTVTSMQDNFIVGNGQGNGILASACIFDADPLTPGEQTVPGGDLDLGQGTAPGQRIEDTALVLDFCFGALGFDVVDIFQAGGDSAGFINTGGLLTLTFGTLTVDHVP